MLFGIHSNPEKERDHDIMNKKQFTEAVAKNGELTYKEAEKAVNLIFDTLTETLSTGEAVQIKGFGAFSVKAREERYVRNPKTNERCLAPAAKRPVFAAGEPLRKSVNGEND